MDRESSYRLRLVTRWVARCSGELISRAARVYTGVRMGCEANSSVRDATGCAVETCRFFWLEVKPSTRIRKGA